MLLKFIFLLSVLVYLMMALDVVLERPGATYFNPKYFEYINISIRKYSRRSPYYLTLETVILNDYGDNYTLNFVLYEQVSGRYIPTGVDATYRLCDFLHNEPYLGKMLAKQIPNLTCPGHRGKIMVSNITMNFDNFPFKLTFLWSRTKISGRADFNFYVTKTKERALEFQVHVFLTQKLDTKVKKIN